MRHSYLGWCVRKGVGSGGGGAAGDGGRWSCFAGWRPGTNLAKQKEVNTCIDLCGSGRVGVTG